MEDESHLKKLGELHFSDLFKDDRTTNIADQLKVISIFPSFVHKEDVGIFHSEITLQEVEVALKCLKKDKIPRLMVGQWSYSSFLLI